MSCRDSHEPYRNKAVMLRSTCPVVGEQVLMRAKTAKTSVDRNGTDGLPLQKKHFSRVFCPSAGHLLKSVYLKRSAVIKTTLRGQFRSNINTYSTMDRKYSKE